MDEGALVQVYASGDAIEGSMMRGRLEAEGISVMVKGEPEGPYRVGPAYLWVPVEDEAKARAVVEAVRSGAFALPDDADVGSADADRSQDPGEQDTP